MVRKDNPERCAALVGFAIVVIWSAFFSSYMGVVVDRQSGAINKNKAIVKFQDVELLWHLH